MAEPSDKTAVDIQHLCAFTQGDSALERELFELFLSGAQAYLAIMARPPDGRAWLEAAHSLKGAARGIGAFKLADLAEAAETLPEASGLERQLMLHRLESALSRVREFVRSRT
jgi:HPt (histidine-containing phosphotransfer) domain-containing protein